MSSASLGFMWVCSTCTSLTDRCVSQGVRAARVDWVWACPHMFYRWIFGCFIVSSLEVSSTLSRSFLFHMEFKFIFNYIDSVWIALNFGVVTFSADVGVCLL